MYTSYTLYTMYTFSLELFIIFYSIWFQIRSGLRHSYIYVREQNFGWPSMIWQSHTSSNKGSIRHVRHARVLFQASGTSLITNTGSIGAARAHLRAHAHQRNAGQNSDSVKQKLETHKHILNRCTTGARTIAHRCVVYPVDRSFGLPYKSLPLEVFFLKIFNRTSLLILIGSRSDLNKYQRRS